MREARLQFCGFLSRAGLLLLVLLASGVARAGSAETPPSPAPGPGTESPARSMARRIVLVRHAEKVDESPQAELSTAGHARAGRLADLLASADVRRIFVSEYVRTQQTAQPLADRLQIKPVRLPAGARQELVSALTSANPEGTTLVVGHSNTLPILLASLGLDGVSIPANDYGSVFVVVLPATANLLPSGCAGPGPGAAASPTLIRLRY